MKHLVLDTNIFRKTPRLDSPEFKSLAYLSKKKCVHIHVPYIVEREFVTHLELEQRERISTAIRSLKSATKHAPLGKVSSKLPKIASALEQQADALTKERSAAFIAWLEDVGGQRHPLSIKESRGALEAYFNGLPPLKEPKVRKDIPDAFIFQSVLRINDTYKSDLGVIAEDVALRTACKDAGIDVFSSLADFLASDTAKTCLADAVIDDHKCTVLAQVAQVAHDAGDDVLNAIENALLSDDYRLISGDGIPGESNEIYVSGVNTPQELELSDFEHLGAGVFVCRFIAKVELIYEYAVYMSEAFDLDRDKFYVEALNDHYMNVETTDTFSFTGRVDFDFGEEILVARTRDSSSPRLHIRV
jgi:hypothetical protein